MEYILQTNHLTKVIDKREIVHDLCDEDAYQHMEAFRRVG